MKTIDGIKFAQMINLGASNLAANADKVDALNVFPVPDGDTGTNMNLSMSSGATEAVSKQEQHIGNVGKAFAKGLLMGARGNSGVILSQLFRGFSKYIEEYAELDATTFAKAFDYGVKVAYKAVIKPVEGTILTVAREAAEAAMAAIDTTDDIIDMMKIIVEAGQVSLENTPELLPVLKEVGVVDSGGQGLMCVYRGFLAELTGEKIQGVEVKVNIDKVDLTANDEHHLRDFMSPEDIEFGYCTEFMVRFDKEKGRSFDEETFRKEMSQFGDSLLVISDDEVVKVHIHAEHPGDVFNYGQQYGELIKVKADNMREQHREVLKSDRAKMNPQNQKPLDYAIITVAMGSGIAEMFKSMGANFVIEGGQTMNPSTEDFVKAMNQIKAERYILLPNNKNIILAAKQAAELSEANVIVVETRSVPQGLSALLAFNSEVSLDENMESMTSSLDNVKTGQITFAVRDTKIDGVEIRKDEFMGINESKIISSNKDHMTVIKQLLDSLIDEESEILTVIVGENVEDTVVDEVLNYCETTHSEVEVEIHKGEQPLYTFIFGVE